MRPFEDRYTRQLRRYLLATRMLRHEARTSTIITWTGLSRDRIRKLAQHPAGPDSSATPIRHRGQPPRQIGYFFKSSRITVQAVILGWLSQQTEAVPHRRFTGPFRQFASLDRGERLCEAYEVYLSLTEEPITFE